MSELPLAPGKDGYSDEDACRAELVRACKILRRLDITDVIGHMSARLTGGRILVKPRSVSWDTLSSSDLVVIDSNGEPEIHQESPPLREWPIHTVVYKRRPEVMSVLHAHPVDSVLMATLGLPFEPLTREAMEFADGLPVLDSREANLFRRTLIDTPALGADVADALGRSRALILKHHGTVIAGTTIGEVVVIAYGLERAAQAILKAASITGGRAVMSADMRDAIFLGMARPHPLPAHLVTERWEMLQGRVPDLLEKL